MLSRLLTNNKSIKLHLFLIVFCNFIFFDSKIVKSQSYTEELNLSQKIDRLEKIIIENSSNNRNISNQETIIENLNPNEVEARLQARMLQLEKLIEDLTGQVEETRFELSQLKREMKLSNEDIKYRLSYIEEKAGVSIAVSDLPSFNNSLSVNESQLDEEGANQRNLRIEPVPGIPLSTPVQSQPAMDDLDTLNQVQQNSTPEDTMGILFTNKDGKPLPPKSENLFLGQDQVAEEIPKKADSITQFDLTNKNLNIEENEISQGLILPNGTDQDQYNYAFEILRLANGPADYEKAERALRAFLDKNPSSDLAGNAQYWIGETFYVRSDFERAAVEFLAGYEQYPSSVKGPDNLLKLGLSLARLDQKDVACASLSKLSTEYPSASDTIKRRAQSERGNLKCS